MVTFARNLRNKKSLMLKFTLTGCILMFFSLVLRAQDSSQISFTYSQHRINDTAVNLTITARVLKPGIALFPLQQKETDPVYSQVNFDSASQKFLTGKLAEKGNIQSVQDPVLNAPVAFVSDSLEWVQTVRVPGKDTALIKGEIAYMYKNGDAFPAENEMFRFVIMPDKKDVAAPETAGTAGGSLWWIFLAAFGGGLLALLTPCVYSMIPVTVSFFTKRSKTHREGIRNALYYSISIILIFTLLGFLITLFFGPAALNRLATNWIANLVFFLIFLIFGISFLGAFEIELPASWGTRADKRAGIGSFWGIFFMALTLVIVSFSCTGPIIGNLLVLAARGSYFGPLVGMFGFSLALALPFALFAFFPGKLNLLGKAGGWLNAVKVTLGFLELALALKFLSNADLAKNWRILDREIFISLWLVIFLLLGLYLLGKLKFRHDDELPKNDFGLPFLTVTRLFFGMASLFMVFYMLPGLWGAPLKGLSAFLPPMGTQDFISAGNTGDGNQSEGGGSHTTSFMTENDQGKLPPPQKYVDVMRPKEPPVVVNNGLVTYFDYEEALGVARKMNRPLMMDFTGVNCINCRHMEGRVWSDPEVMRRLKNNFVIASLFVDVHNGVDLPVAEQYYSPELKKQVETLGDRNTDIQVTRFDSNSQPFYFFLDGNEQRLAPDGYPYDPSVEKFVAHLDKVVAEFKKRKQ
jgi:thiol:disulfide interchange protein DsbD